MATIAVVGAGKGLGAAVARRYGAEGFDVALLSRTQDNVDVLAADLREAGVTAQGYAGNVRRPDNLAAALDRATAELGPIDVLRHSHSAARVPARGARHHSQRTHRRR